jgi:hypothetical protein
MPTLVRKLKIDSLLGENSCLEIKFGLNPIATETKVECNPRHPAIFTLGEKCGLVDDLRTALIEGT